jgi:hypothetical protein
MERRYRLSPDGAFPPLTPEPQSWVRVGSSTREDPTAALEEALAELDLPSQAKLLVVMAVPR